MALSYKSRRRLSLLVLVLGVPLYIAVAVRVIALFDRPSFVVELAVYAGLGVLWAFPLRAVFLGVGRADPEAEPSEGRAPAREPETSRRHP